MATYKRLFEDDINKWYESNAGEALVVKGARQVGKTTGIKHWAETNNIKYHYINFIDYEDLAEELCHANSYEQVIDIINIHFEINLNDYNVLFLDEIQIRHDLLYLTRLFKDKNVRLICSGSLLGMRLAKEVNRTDVGSKIYLQVYPLDFKEFLIWTKHEMLLGEIDKSFAKQEQIQSAAHKKLSKLFLDYLYLGGMPRVLENFIENNFLISPQTSELRASILNDYLEDNHNDKYLGTSLRDEVITNMNSIFSSMSDFLFNQNSKKFVIDSVGKNIRYRNIEKPLYALVSSNIVIPTYLVETPSYPLSMHKTETSFKLYYSDIGLLLSKLKISRLELDKWFESKSPISGLMGGVIENYVAITLRSEELFYWKKSIKVKKPDGTVSKKSVDYELDFLVSSLDSEIIPIEVKSRTKQKSKATSLDKYIELYNPKKVYILSPGNFAKKGNEYYIPLYSAFKLREVIK